MPRPVIVMEDDVAIRPLQVMADPDCPEARRRAFGDYMRHDIPDFQGWCAVLREEIPSLWPARVVPAADAETLAKQVPEAVALIVEDLPVTRNLLETASRLRIVIKFGTSLDKVDLAASADHGVRVQTQRRRTNVAVAEHTMALLLALAKQLPRVGGAVTPARLASSGRAPARYDRAHTANSNWGRFAGLKTLQGATLGLLGLGEIGAEVACMAQGFGMNVRYNKRSRFSPDEEVSRGLSYAEMSELLANSDFISVHLPMNDETRGLLDRAAFSRMKPGAVLINTARAAIVDHDALVHALTSGHLGGAGFDVLFDEPAKEDEELLGFDNVLLTPHLAGGARFNGVDDLADMLRAIDGALRAPTA